MTCLQYKTLLDDFADNNLAPEHVQKLEEHLVSCVDCKRELDATYRLKELLLNTTSPNPGDFYFNETTDLIFARTIEKNNLQFNQIEKSPEAVKSEFSRALLSAAAALVILAISIVIGTSENKFAQNNIQKSPVFVMTPVEQNTNPQNSPIFTKAEQLNHIQGLLLISPPGMLGRLSVIHEYNRLVD